ncbi:MAG: hypothetical protein ACJ0BI_01420 [Paracoccaceae bacterium]
MKSKKNITAFNFERDVDGFNATRAGFLHKINSLEKRIPGILMRKIKDGTPLPLTNEKVDMYMAAGLFPVDSEIGVKSANRGWDVFTQKHIYRYFLFMYLRKSGHKIANAIQILSTKSDAEFVAMSFLRIIKR